MKFGIIAIILICLLIGQTASAAECGMNRSFAQPDPDSPGGKVAVWADRAGKSLFFIGGLKTNTDGAKRSYSVPDFWGEQTALNNLCNANEGQLRGIGFGSIAPAENLDPEGAHRRMACR